MARKMRKQRVRVGRWLGGVALALLSLQACGSDSSISESNDSGNYNDTDGTDPSANGATSGEGTSVTIGENNGGAAALPNETEVNVDFEAPQASVGYVYATNPDLDTVAVIDAKTLAIQIVETGDEPRFLKTIPGKDAALLVDVAAKDIAYLQTKDAKSTVQYFTNLPAANAIAVAPDGKHALAYFDVTRRTQGTIETLQDVTVLSLAGETPVATRMTIGFQARQVIFAGGDEGAAAAYVVTDDGVSVLDFAEIDEKGSSIAKTVPVFSAIEQKAADVSVTPDGKYALGRIESSSQLRLVELATGAAQNLNLAAILPAETNNNTGTGGSNGTGGTNGTVTAQGGATNAVGGSSSPSSTVAAATITDLDLSADGSYALAVSRDRSTLLRIPIPAGFTDTSQITKTKIEGVLVGSTSLSPNGRWAILYTSVSSEERIVIVDLTSEIAPRPLDLKKAVEGVTFSSSGEQAFVVHQKAVGDPSETTITTEQQIDRSYGYSLVDLKSGFSKLTVTETAPLQTVLVPGKPYVFMAFTGTNFKVQKINMDSMVDYSLDLGTRPVSMGVVASAERIFVNQDHPEGRLTFIDWETLATRSVTGYELNSMIRE